MGTDIATEGCMRDERESRWGKMSPFRKAVFITMTVIQLALAGAAWADLAQQPPARVRGAKWAWALVIAVNFVGPLSYFRWGRIATGGDLAWAGGNDEINR